MSVFDSEKLLTEWRDQGKWPSIHDEFIGLVHHTAAADASIMDVCCSTGILPQRVQDQCGRRACGVEWLQSAIDTGRSFGVNVPILCSNINRDSLDVLAAWMADNGVSAVSARRCLSELAVPPSRPNGPPSTNTIDFEFSELLFTMFRDAGVTDLWLQGRAFSTRSTHPVPDTDSEVAWVEASGAFRVHRRTRNCAWLRPT